MTLDDWRRSWKPWLRGVGLGFPIGALPAGGAEVPTLLSYTIERKLARKPNQFGKGAIEGVAGPEAANNAAATGTLVPLLALGLPTSATAAMLLAGFQQYGLVPGPLLFVTNTDLVWGLIASFFIGNLMLLVLNLPLVGLWVQAADGAAALPLRRHPGLRGDGHAGGEPVDRRAGAAGRASASCGYLMRCWDYPRGADDRRPDPRARWPRASSGARCRSAWATVACSSSIPARPRCSRSPSSRCSRRCVFKGLRKFQGEDA